MTPGERYAATARRVAKAILSRPPFTARRAGRDWFTRFLNAIGRTVVAVLRWIVGVVRRDLAHPINHGAHSAFGSWTNVVLVAVGALLVVALALVLLIVRRRARPGGSRGSSSPEHEARRQRVARLLDEAEQARRTGDLDSALRLRFEAGLERLEARGVVFGRTTLTSTQLSTQLASSTFDELASVHTLVAYGGAHASEGDVEQAFESWPQVIEEARRDKVGTP